ncbi:hypothetical protein Ade02nite_71730 [Paractinoplanes deccanensis]|uniref:Uncharacterized protein n=1 Tax=Paractinoplanes deccanensis TaxID=113561 RepID=A0ABQ3YEU7_9ACTN|nr:hypothetical protein Ade02nite_71730 [Actinoplanes deccanensis]
MSRPVRLRSRQRPPAAVTAARIPSCFASAAQPGSVGTGPGVASIGAIAGGIAVAAHMA